jgi:hypothetical protein
MTLSAAVAHRRRSGLVDAPEIHRDDSADEVLDVAVQYTFPASDPIAVEDAYGARLRRRSTRT